MSAVGPGWMLNVAGGAGDVCRTEQTSSLRRDARSTVQAVASAEPLQADDGQKIHFIRLRLQQSRAGSLTTRLRPQGWLGLQLPRVPENLRRIKALKLSVHQHRHLSLGVDVRHYRMFLAGTAAPY